MDEDQAVTDEGIISASSELQGIAWNEFETIYIANRIEKRNCNAARSQVALNHLVMNAELKVSMKLGQAKPNFGDEVKRIEQTCAEQEKRTIPNLPVTPLKQLEGLLYEPVFPNVGAKASIRLPVPLFQGALMQAQRTANMMHVKKSDLSTTMVSARLEKELEKVLSEMV